MSIQKVKKVMNTPSKPKKTNGLPKTTANKIMNTKKYSKGGKC